MRAEVGEDGVNKWRGGWGKDNRHSMLDFLRKWSSVITTIKRSKVNI